MKYICYSLLYMAERKPAKQETPISRAMSITLAQRDRRVNDAESTWPIRWNGIKWLAAGLILALLGIGNLSVGDAYGFLPLALAAVNVVVGLYQLISGKKLFQ